MPGSPFPTSESGVWRPLAIATIVQPGPEVPIHEQVHAEQGDGIGERPSEHRLQLEVSEDQQRDQGGPDLDVKRVRGGADESLHAQVLLQGFEQLDLPPVFIDAGDRGRAEAQMIRQEHEPIAVRRDHLDAPQGLSPFVLPTLGALPSAIHLSVTTPPCDGTGRRSTTS